MQFLSERNVEMHKEYLNVLLLKYKIFEKAYPSIVGCDIEGIYKSKIPISEREAAGKLFSEILAHKIYFSSYANTNSVSERVKREYGSVAQFLYELKEKCKECDSGFMLIYTDKGRVKFYYGTEYEKILRFKDVKLSLDLCEHAYFYDYGFKREDYVLNAIMHLDLNKLEKSEN